MARETEYQSRCVLVTDAVRRAEDTADPVATRGSRRDIPTTKAVQASCIRGFLAGNPPRIASPVLVSYMNDDHGDDPGRVRTGCYSLRIRFEALVTICPCRWAVNAKLMPIMNMSGTRAGRPAAAGSRESRAGRAGQAGGAACAIGCKAGARGRSRPAGCVGRPVPGRAAAAEPARGSGLREAPDLGL